eukprot:3473861-Prymnesium_polylepis.3
MPRQRVEARRLGDSLRAAVTRPDRSAAVATRLASAVCSGAGGASSGVRLRLFARREHESSEHSLGVGSLPYRGIGLVQTTPGAGALVPTSPLYTGVSMADGR